jgi:predicted transcriptional regulator
MKAAMHEANNMYIENERLKEEVDRLKDIIKVRDNTIHMAHGLAEENASLHKACQTLVDENSKLMEEARLFRGKLRSNEEEIARLNEEGNSQSTERFHCALLYSTCRQAPLRQRFQ